jgi:hypothetical protein
VPTGPADVDPRALVRSFRATYTDMRRHVGPHTAGPAALVASPADRPVDEDSLPRAARSLIAEYRAAHPDVAIAWERRMRATEAGPTLVVDDDRNLPEEDALISVGITVTLTTSDTARVVTDVLVGRLGP